MSAPRSEMRDAEYLGLGFLAVTSSELLKRLVARAELTDDERHTLRRAAAFLKDVSSGAKLVASGTNASASESDLRKFSYAVEPLRSIQHHIAAVEIEGQVTGLAESIEDAISQSPAIDATRLNNAQRFFDSLYRFLMDLVETGRRRRQRLESAHM